MLRTALALLLLLGLAACASSGHAPALDVHPVHLRAGEPMAKAAEAHYVGGREQLAEGQYGLALEAFRKALYQEGRTPRILNAIAITYDELRRFDLAERYYLAALEIEPDSRATLNNLGRSLLRRGDFARAHATLSQAALLPGADGVVAHNLSLAEHRLTEPSPDSVNPLVTGRAGHRTVQRRLRIEPIALNEQLLRTRSVSDRSDEATGRSEAARTMAATAAASAPDRVRVEVANGAGRSRMARRMGVYLARQGMEVEGLVNAAHFGFERSLILHRPGFEEAARRLQAQLPFAVPIEASPLPLRDVRLRLGHDLLHFDATLQGMP